MATEAKLNTTTISGVKIDGHEMTTLAKKPSKEVPPSIKAALLQHFHIVQSYRSLKGVTGTSGTSGSAGPVIEFTEQDIENFFVEYESFNDREGDSLFEKYGIGNISSGVSSPFERAKSYESLLKILNDYDPAQFLKIHKGTPYYFMGWTAFQFEDYEKSLFYMDAAASDDLRFPNVMDQTSTRPAVDFFLLNNKPGGSGFVIHQHMSDVVEKTLHDFASRSSVHINKTDLVDKFIKPLLYSDVKKRSVLTSLYSFLLKFEKRKSEIKLRAATGGSIQPFLDHLFDGAVLLESILGIQGTGITLKPKIVSLPQLSIDASVLFGNKNLADAEPTFNAMVTAAKSHQDCVFAASYIIRNTTGHNLVWPDEFVDEKIYTTLYNCLVDAIFWSIYKLWIE